MAGERFRLTGMNPFTILRYNPGEREVHPMSDALKDAAAEIRRRIEESVATIKAMPQMADITAAIQTLNGLEDLMKEPRTSLAEVFGLAGSGTARMAESW